MFMLRLFMNFSIGVALGKHFVVIKS